MFEVIQMGYRMGIVRRWDYRKSRSLFLSLKNGIKHTHTVSGENIRELRIPGGRVLIHTLHILVYVF